MSRSDCGSKIAVGLESTNLRERARFYADRNQIETAVFFAGQRLLRSLFATSFTLLQSVSLHLQAQISTKTYFYALAFSSVLISTFVRFPCLCAFPTQPRALGAKSF